MNLLDDKALLRGIKRAKTVSFDIFDTLIRRAFIKPVDVFFAIEKDLKRPGFAKARIEAEQLARKTSQKDEVNLDEIYRLLSRNFAALKDTEIAYELLYCVRNDEVGAVYDHVVGLGKPVILVSDMYLPREVIEKMLLKAGYTKHQRFFLSNEVGTQKVSQLFPYIAKELGCNFRDILHIGDNAIGDVKAPKSFGVVVKPYQPALNRLISDKKWLAREIEDLGNDPDISYLFSFVVQFATQDDTTNDVVFDIGASVVWLMSVLFCSWLVEVARAKGISKAFFLSRDGFLFKKVFDSLFAEESAISAEKLYVSRRAIAVPVEIATKGNFALLNYGKDESGTLSKEALWELMNIDDADLQAKFDSFLDKEFAGEDQAPTYAVDLFVSEYLDDVRGVFESERRRAEHYLEEAGVFEGDCILVDIGWGGTMQRALTEMTQERQRGNTIVGAYLGTNRTCGLPNDSAFGFAINRELPQSHSRVLNIDLVELFFTVPAASVKTYARQGERMAPTFMKIGQREAARQRVSESVNQGLDAMNDFFLSRSKMFDRRLVVAGCPEGMTGLLRHMWRVAVENRNQFEKLSVLPGHSEAVVWKMYLRKPPED
jgi:predicted HAD superfamily hydrolase